MIPEHHFFRFRPGAPNRRPGDQLGNRRESDCDLLSVIERRSGQGSAVCSPARSAPSATSASSSGVDEPSASATTA